MGFWKLTLFLALSILIPVGILQAAPVSADIQSRNYPNHSPQEESLLVLADVMRAYALKMKTSGRPQKIVTSPDVSREKRCNNLSTCVLGTYTQDLNRFHTFPQTAVGVGAPGKRFVSNGPKRNQGSHTGRLQNTL